MHLDLQTVAAARLPERPKKLRHWPGLSETLIALALGLLSVPAHAGTTAADEVQIGQTLREARLQGLNGPPQALSAFRGSPLIINVWASWCGPCRNEMASLERLAWQAHKVPFVVIGISTDDEPDNAKRVLAATNATISHFIDSRLQLETMLGASRIPLTVLVDADGQVLDKVFGAKQWDGPEAKALIESAFRKGRRAPMR